MFTIEKDGTRVIPLERGFEGHKGYVKELRLRAPTYSDFMRFGDPTTLIVASNAIVPQDDLVTIKGYVESLSDADPLLLEKLTLGDAIAARDAVKSFFADGSAKSSIGSPSI